MIFLHKKNEKIPGFNWVMLFFPFYSIVLSRFLIINEHYFVSLVSQAPEATYKYFLIALSISPDSSLREKFDCMAIYLI